MSQHGLVSDIPSSLFALPPSSTPSCIPCVKAKQCASPHSSFTPTNVPLQTLDMDVGPTTILGPRREHFFLVVVEDYSRHITVIPLERKADVPGALLPWLVAIRAQHFQPVLHLHSECGAEFASGPRPTRRMKIARYLVLRLCLASRAALLMSVILVTNPTAPPPFVSALVAAVTDFASAHRLDHATQLVSATARSLSVGGAPALGNDVLEDRQFDVAFLAAAAPHL
ncbi:unnamed protein product [Closterium sp. NIES-53]